MDVENSFFKRTAPGIQMVDEKDIVETVRKSILKYRMIEPGEKAVVAVSGGADSVCLLDIMARLSKNLNINLIVAHYDHGLRKSEDEFETQFVYRIAASLGLPFETEKASGLHCGMPSLEERAREARYEFLERVRIKSDARKIALGHTMNDQAETVLMRLLRGSGPSGLSGIPPVRGKNIIRPLIDVKREEIIKYLDSRCLDFVSDSSNINKKYMRNSIRLELMPLMLKHQPQLIENLSRLSNILRDENSILDAWAEEWADKNVLFESAKDISIGLEDFNSLLTPLKYRVIRHILKRLLKNLRRVDYRHLVYVTHLAESNRSQSSIDMPNGISVKKSYDRLIFQLSNEARSFEYCYSLERAGKVHIEETGQTISAEEIEWDSGKELFEDIGESTALLDAEKLNYPLIIRNIRPGDRFVPLGMTGTKKIKDFFIDLKLPSEKRHDIPIITSDKNIIWICGYRIDDRYKVTNRTKRVLKITCK